jgi:hypothetical protein
MKGANVTEGRKGERWKKLRRTFSKGINLRKGKTLIQRAVESE